MSRFGWAYVNDVITGSGGSTTPGGSNKTIQFASGSTFSGSTNFTFDYNTNTVRLTGTLYADNLIVSSSVIYTSGSTKFGDDVGDTHQFTGSLYNTTLISGSAAQFTTIKSQGAIITGSLLMSGTSYISEVDYIDFDVSASVPTWKNGRIFWDNTNGALAVYNAEADITLQVGQESYVRVRNQTGSPITDGSAVRLSGALGDRPTIILAQATIQTASTNTNDIIGVATHTIEHGTDGYVTTQGLVNGLNTAAYSAGDMLWLSSSAGQLTNVKPTSPYDQTFVGIVTRANASNGSIFVFPHEPTHLHDLSDTIISSRQNGDLLLYNSSTQVWRNTKSLSGSYDLSGSLSASSTITAGNLNINGLISGSSLQISSSGQFGSNINASGLISSSVGLQTGGSGQFGSNVTSNGLISSSVGFQTAGSITAGASITGKNGLIITGSAIIAGGNLSVTGSVFANGYVGDGNGITGINGANVNGVGNDWTLQFKNGATGTLTGSSNLVFTGSNLNVIGTVNAITSSFNRLEGRVTGTLVLDSIVSWDSTNKQFLNSSIYTVGISQAIISASNGLVVSGATNLGTVYERLLLTSSIPATVNFDTSNQSTLYINNPPANFTLNFTNVSTTDSRVSTYNVIISQSATPYSASSVQVNTTASTVKWANSTTPTGNASKHDVYGFSLIRSGSTWVTLGQLSTYG